MTARAVRLYVALAFGILVWGASTDARALDEINAGIKGYAIHGYDPVAYHRAGLPTKGLESFRATRDGVTYLFATAENRDAFVADPETYEPAYGGWCSYGVRVGRKFDIDPNAFRIVDGRLYLQLDMGTQKVWAEDTIRNIAIADRIWPSIRSIPAAQLGE